MSKSCSYQIHSVKSSTQMQRKLHMTCRLFCIVKSFQMPQNHHWPNKLRIITKISLKNKTQRTQTHYIYTYQYTMANCILRWKVWHLQNCISASHLKILSEAASFSVRNVSFFFFCSFFASKTSLVSYSKCISKQKCFHCLIFPIKPVLQLPNWDKVAQSLLIAGMWKRLNFCGSGSTLMKEVESGSESVEKEPEAEAIFSKSGASGFSTWLQPLG